MGVIFRMVSMLMTGSVITIRDDCETIDQHVERHENAVKEASQN